VLNQRGGHILVALRERQEIQAGSEVTGGIEGPRGVNANIQAQTRTCGDAKIVTRRQGESALNTQA